MTCEEQDPTMNYLASNFNDSPHTITMENNTSVNASFFYMSYFSIVMYSLMDF